MPTILVIDDDWHMGLILKRVLGKHGFDILVATDGPSGIRQALESCPDLILLDIIMKGMNGPEVVRRLRQEPACADTPIVFLTAYATATGRRQAGQAEVNGFISKPFVVDDLVAQVKQLAGVSGGPAES